MLSPAQFERQQILKAEGVEKTRGYSQRHRGVADQSRQEAEDARYLSKATFVKLKELHCARASSLPGENCEVTFLVKGPDGKEEERLGAYRFDQRNGALAVVGSVEPS